MQRSHDSSLNDCDIEADIENTADEQSHIEVEGDVNVEDSDIEDVATVSKRKPQKRKMKRSKEPANDAEYSMMISLKESIDERNRLQREKQVEIPNCPEDLFC